MCPNNSEFNFDQIAKKIRSMIIDMSFNAQSSHLGGALSIVDGLVTIYFSKVFNLTFRDILQNKSDKVIFGKGHAASALYATLAEVGVISTAELLEYKQNGNLLTEHPSVNSYPGVDWATGSLGHALPIACGLAYGYLKTGDKRKVIAILSDGDCQEGSTWEAFMLAGKLQLDNLYCFIDANKYQATGKVIDITNLYPISEKISTFGWHSVELNGNNSNEIFLALSQTMSIEKKPKAYVLNTEKGFGVSFMVGDNNWHYKFPNQAEYDLALKELALDEK